MTSNIFIWLLVSGFITTPISIFSASKLLAFLEDQKGYIMPTIYAFAGLISTSIHIIIGMIFHSIGYLP
jgi:hypothetical protein